ncbi:MAG TPA: hypothetical protein VK970_20635 [Candidatus Methylacidiphilales bacterium]|nr:hypothetical protein [Candidatus Methylacidiphilales bacterium]
MNAGKMMRRICAPAVLVLAPACALVLFAGLHLTGCATASTRKVSATEQNAVGLYRDVTFSAQNRYMVTIRRADGTFLSKFTTDDASTSAGVERRMSGRWRLTPAGYFTYMVDMALDGVWKEQNGVSFSQEVRKTTREGYEFLSPEGALCREVRLGDASDAAFEETPLIDRVANEQILSRR